LAEQVEINKEGEVIEQEKKPGKLKGKFFSKKNKQQETQQEKEEVQKENTKPPTETNTEPINTQTNQATEQTSLQQNKLKIYKLAYQYLSYEELIGLITTKYNQALTENEKLTDYLKKQVLNTKE